MKRESLVVTIALTQEDLDKLNELAGMKHDGNRSMMIREIIRSAYENYQQGLGK